MNWSKIESLLSECTKQTGASSVPDDIGLGDYREVLERYNGIEGFVGNTVTEFGAEYGDSAYNYLNTLDYELQ